MVLKNKNLLLISALILTIAVGVFTTLYFLKKPHLSDLQKQGTVGEAILKDFSSQPLINISENENNYQIKDILRQGVTIQYASLTEEQKKAQENEPKDELNIELPKNYTDPINIKLDEQRIISITDKNGSNFSDKLITEDVPVIIENQELEIENQELNNEEQKEIDVEQLAQPTTQSINYLKYQDKSKRKAVYYAYQKEPETRNLKHWTIYQNQNKKQTEEKETYQISNAKLKLNAKGEIEVFYFGEKDIQNEQVKAEVAPSLLERAQKTLQKELGEDILNSEGYTPDFIIPTPYYLNKNQETKSLKWELNQETNEISVNFTPQKDEYPIALDPTLQFTAPGQGSEGNSISLDHVNSNFGRVLNSGDFNADGRVDLAVANNFYASSTGRVYIFYNDGLIPNLVTDADLIITGEVQNSDFGRSMVSGDFNYDGNVDLVVGASGYLSSTGRAYIFYNDGSIPTTAASADVIITGETMGSYFSLPLTSGDLNADGRVDLIVAARVYSGSTGRTYIFYNDSLYPVTADMADVIITGEGTNNYFGYSMASGDFNYDGTIDLAVGARGYSSNIGRAYIFYNDGSIPTTAASADRIITGETTDNNFGGSIASGDFNADGRIDLTVSAYGYSSSTGRAYIFYNDGSIPTTAVSADRIITGEVSSSYFGDVVNSGDFNADGRIDLVVGSSSYSSSTGRVYIFYNDGSIPTTAATADVIITGEASNSGFGISMTSGDFNADGRTDLTVGAQGYSSITGRVYIFYNDGSIPTMAASADVIITGAATSNYFGHAMHSGDFNADGRTDLVVGAYGYSSSTGRAYIFYNDGSIPTTAATADVIIAGQTTNNNFGGSIASGDFNADGRTDLVVGAQGYSSNTGRAYIFYNDGSIPTTAASADVIITGAATSNYFGSAIHSGDFNADGRTDLVVGAYNYSSSTGRAYIFYNDGSIPTTAATANVIITGEANSSFGKSFSSGDFNADGRVDLAVGAYNYSSNIGRAYIFYNDGSIPITAVSADVVITGESSGAFFAWSLNNGDFNADGKTDLAVGAYYYLSDTGRAYIFYNDGSIPTTAATADVIITGEKNSGRFGYSLNSGDFNADGKTDLVVGAYAYPPSSYGKIYIFYSQNGQLNFYNNIQDINFSKNFGFGASMTSEDFDYDGDIDLAVGSSSYSSNTGRAYIFYNDGSIPTTAATADVIITGEATNNYFGSAMYSGDFNADGRTDLVVGASGYSSSIGRAYIFYNDGSIPTTAATADVIITGEATNNSFGDVVHSGDFNADGRIDLVVDSHNYSSNTGRAYIFYNDGSIPTTAATADVIITGEATSNYFGSAMYSGDFNTDGKMDLAVGAYGYSSTTGRAYIFYNDGSIPTTAAAADIIITGEEDSSYGNNMISGDFNNDGKTDLAVGAYGYSSTTGRAYIFYNDGSIPTTAATADATITGGAGSYFGISMASGDFNYDGTIDLAIGSGIMFSFDDKAYIFYNDGSYPSVATSADVIITKEDIDFGYSMASGDFNGDGKTDLAVVDYSYFSSAGRVYIFYNDGSYPLLAADADNKITGDPYSSYFGVTLSSGDYDNNGNVDLAVGSYGYLQGLGKIYLFYSDGAMGTTPETADISIVGESEEGWFGRSMSSGDLNNDNQTDLIVGAYGNNTNTGKVYIFYNDGSYPSLATDADIKITGENTNDYFGYSLTTGNITGDSHTDLIIGANGYSTNTGRTYIFNNDGSIPTTASSADNIITGQNTNDYFGSSLITGDFDYDMDNDLVVGAYGYNTNTGRAYIFNNDSSYPTLATDSDIKIDGEGTNNYFSGAFTGGDFNDDNRVDLISSAYGYSANSGRVYIFNNDGSISPLASGADNIIIGENENNAYFGYVLAEGDLNGDNKTDFAVGAYGWGNSAGKFYIFNNDGDIPNSALGAESQIGGARAGNKLGISMLVADLNQNNKNDLCVGYIDPTWQGGFYIYEMDAEGTKPDYVETNGRVQFNGNVLIK